MERPGFEPPLCAMSTNRSLYAIYSQMPMDRYAILHRRMTAVEIYAGHFRDRTPGLRQRCDHGRDLADGIGTGESAGALAHGAEQLGICEQGCEFAQESIGVDEFRFGQHARGAGVAEDLGVAALMVVGGEGEGDEQGRLAGGG